MNEEIRHPLDSLTHIFRSRRRLSLIFPNHLETSQQQNRAVTLSHLSITTSGMHHAALHASTAEEINLGFCESVALADQSFDRSAYFRHRNMSV